MWDKKTSSVEIFKSSGSSLKLIKEDPNRERDHVNMSLFNQISTWRVLSVCSSFPRIVPAYSISGIPFSLVLEYTHTHTYMYIYI